MICSQFPYTAIGVGGQPGVPAVKPAIKVTRRDPGCVMIRHLSSMAIYAKENLFKCRCAKETGLNAKAAVKLMAQVRCHLQYAATVALTPLPLQKNK